MARKRSKASPEHTGVLAWLVHLYDCAHVDKAERGKSALTAWQLPSSSPSYAVVALHALLSILH